MTATRMSDSATRGAEDAPRDELGPEDASGPSRDSSLVRILQQSLGSSPYRGRFVGICLFVVAGWIVVALGCGPLETDRPEARPPYLDPDSVKPAQRVISIDTPETVNLSVTAFDPNRETILNAVWTNESTPLKTSELLRGGTTEINGENFYEYESASITVDPCQIADGGEKETIWLYVADREFRTVSPGQDEISVRPGGYVVTRSWVLSLHTGACT